MSRRSIRSWIDTKACEPEPVLYTDDGQAADRAALLEELADVEFKLEALSRYRGQLQHKLGTCCAPHIDHSDYRPRFS